MTVLGLYPSHHKVDPSNDMYTASINCQGRIKINTVLISSNVKIFQSLQIEILNK
jgi:hypothetical protein